MFSFRSEEEERPNNNVAQSEQGSGAVFYDALLIALALKTLLESLPPTSTLHVGVYSRAHVWGGVWGEGKA